MPIVFMTWPKSASFLNSVILNRKIFILKSAPTIGALFITVTQQLYQDFPITLVQVLFSAFPMLLPQSCASLHRTWSRHCFAKSFGSQALSPRLSLCYSLCSSIQMPLVPWNLIPAAKSGIWLFCLPLSKGKNLQNHVFLELGYFASDCSIYS